MVTIYGPTLTHLTRMGYTPVTVATKLMSPDITKKIYGHKIYLLIVHGFMKYQPNSCSFDFRYSLSHTLNMNISLYMFLLICGFIVNSQLNFSSLLAEKQYATKQQSEKFRRTTHHSHIF